MSSQLTERLDARLGLAAGDISTAKTGPYHHLGLHGQAMAVVTTGTVAATKIVTLEILQATDAAGAGAKVIKKVEVVAPTGGAALCVAASVRADELDSAGGFEFVAIRAETDNATAVQATGTMLLGDGRYS